MLVKHAIEPHYKQQCSASDLVLAVSRSSRPLHVTTLEHPSAYHRVKRNMILPVSSSWFATRQKEFTCLQGKKENNKWLVKMGKKEHRKLNSGLKE